MEDLWKEYGEDLKKEGNEETTEDPPEPVPTHAVQMQ